VSHALQLLLILAVIVTAAKLAGALANRIGQPAVFGEILAGLLLGPTFLNALGWPLFHAAEGEALLPVLKDFADVGVILLMFVAGLETDVAGVLRVGKAAFWAATGGVVLPLVGGAATAVAFGLPLYWEGIFIGTILTATSVSISAQTLLELGALRSKEGSTILGAAVIDDVMGIVVLSVVVALAKASAGGVDLTQLALVVVRILAFFGGALLLGRWLTPFLRWRPFLKNRQVVLAAAVVVALVFSWAAEYVGAVAPITGAYVAGVLIAQTAYKHEVDAGIHPLTYSIFVPVFFISIGLQANGRELGDQAIFTLVLVLVAIVAKAIGSGLLARVCGFTSQESVRVGVGMISRGEVGLIVAGYGLTNGLIGRDVFSASVLMVLVTTMITPPLLRLVFPSEAPAVHVGPEPVVEETVVGPPPALEDVN